MTSTVYLHDGPLESGAGAVRVPGQTVREVQNSFGHWREADAYELKRWDIITSPTRESVVSPVVDLEEVPCPECGGEGSFAADDHDEDSCSTCGGEGTVSRLWHAVRQVMNVMGEFLVPAEPRLWDLAFDHERRLAVLGYSDNVQRIPVLGDSDEEMEYEDYPLIELTNDDAIHFDGPLPVPAEVATLDQILSWGSDVTDEPWAADLVPGDVVLRWESVTLLPEPITKERCKDYRHPQDHDCPGTNPLWLVPGLNTGIELAQEGER